MRGKTRFVRTLVVMPLAPGGRDFCGGRMKDPRSAMISRSDGFRPVSFLLEAVDEDA